MHNLYGSPSSLIVSSGGKIYGGSPLLKWLTKGSQLSSDVFVYTALRIKNNSDSESDSDYDVGLL